MPLPPLPSISPDLEVDVFTHKGFHGLPASLRSDEPGAPSNWERLAFLGDAVLQICATDWLYSSFPTSRIGDLTTKRTQIVANSALAGWSSEYELPKRIIAHPSATFQLQNSASEKIRGSLFEAYLAAVYLTAGANARDGLTEAREWIEGILHYEHYDDEGLFRSRLGHEVSGDDLADRVQETKLDSDSDLDYATPAPQMTLIQPRAPPPRGGGRQPGRRPPPPPSPPPPSPPPPRVPRFRTHTMPTSPTRMAVSRRTTHINTTQSQEIALVGHTNDQRTAPPGYVNYLSAMNEKTSQSGLELLWDEFSWGPDHARRWQATLTIGVGNIFTGVGSTKKEARNAAAKKARNIWS